ncbi:S-adenosyl-L-methionine-dependent methyltransferase [Gigaspora margarita]|uniref:S-adenosyl-L-methionine-dependent methyltransferase n=1 Tax=Gigaspora margarita TaxID=4874 RepID=A0A8H4ET67_GIGMA|nr:S-adenosyl-L-methionine-dependent methyltransferase [Gigaspora margarita]
MGLCISKLRKDKFPLSSNNNGLESEIINLSNNRDSNRFHFEDGRRYHNVENAVYFLPNDNDECDRLHLQHFIERYFWQSNFSAPVDHLLNQEGTMVLDVGTGAGSWLLEMATNYPKAKFIGMDISPIQPEFIKPKNAEFIEANVLDPLPFDNNTFDYIFQRILYVGIPGRNWPLVVNELVRVLKPGGYIELLENDFQYSIMGPATTRLINGILIMFDERGLDPTVCYKLQGFLEEHEQLHNVHCEIKKCLDCEDGNKLCKLASENYTTALMTMKPKLMSIIQASSDEYDELVKQMGDELMELESFNPRVRVYAQKKKYEK